MEFTLQVREKWRNGRVFCNINFEYTDTFFLLSKIEPVNLLATLYYLHGRLEESLTLHKIVLSIKPWHVDALSHIVMVYAAMGDSERARQWAAFRLPTLSNGANRRRTRWVERAVVDATILLHKGEKINTISFGESDKTWIGKQRSTFDLQNPDDAWQ